MLAEKGGGGGIGGGAGGEGSERDVGGDSEGGGRLGWSRDSDLGDGCRRLGTGLLINSGGSSSSDSSPSMIGTGGIGVRRA